MINITEVLETNKMDRAGEPGCTYHYYGVLTLLDLCGQ